MSNQLSLFSTPIACGMFKNVPWRSMTCLEEIRAKEIEETWGFIATACARVGNPILSHAEIIGYLDAKTVYQYMTKPLSTQERIDLYRSKAQYNNNFKVL